MDRTELLTYLASIRKEESERLTRHGLTSWALLGAMVGLLLLAIPEFDKISPSASSNLSICSAFSYFHVTLVLGSMLFDGSAIQPSRPADYRFPPTFRSADMNAQFLTMFTYLIVPAVASYCSLRLDNLTAFASMILKANCWTFGIMGVLGIGSVGSAFLSQRRGEPTVMFLSRNVQWLRYWIPHLALGTLFLGLFASNLSLFAHGLLAHQWHPTAEVTIAIAASLVLFVLGIVFRASARNRYQVLLARLERDLVLYGTTAEEVRLRLEQEYLGSQPDAWVLNRLDKLRATAKDISIHADGVETLIGNYREQTGRTVDEHGERVRKYVRDLEKRFDTYSTDAERLVNWLMHAARFGDQYVAQVIEGTIKDVKNVQLRVRDDMYAAIKKLETLFGDAK
jgi:hypothetical protein